MRQKGRPILSALSADASLVGNNIVKRKKQSVITHTCVLRNDVAFDVRRLTNDIPLGTGSESVKKFIMDEVKRSKPDSLPGYSF